MTLENTTLRLPSKLRAIAEERAKAAGHTLAEELRGALESHYKMNATQISFEDLEARVRQHEAEFHGSAVPSQEHKEKEGRKNPQAKPALQKELPLTEKASHEREETRKILLGLKDLLESGVQPMPSDLEESLGMSSRLIGRRLGEVGIQAKNTRIRDKSGRYFLRSLLPLIEAALKELS
ncbi:MAG: hypothetical protein EHM14_10655 [Methanothrix sp.]|nr:MAG: hypothetical protein EHM14_10655 [Methanothrix sp.]